MASLINDLGGTAGFGEFWLPANDDGSTGFIDLTPIFGAQGINFFGSYYTGFYLNNNGSVTFSAASSSFTPSEITASTSNPVIAAYWADIDTRGGAVAPSPGGTSAGTNLLWYDLDPVSHTFTATWDDVGYYDGQTNKLNSFQLSIRQINAQGDFDITFRYENVDWTTGDASGGSNGLGGTPARAGYSAGNSVEYFELPQSGDEAALLSLESATNVGVPGTFVFAVRNGVPTVGITIGDAAVDEGDGGDPHYLSIPVFLTEASTSTVTVHYATSDGTALAGQDHVDQSGILTFAPGVRQQNILVAIVGDTMVEDNETFTVTLFDPSEGASIVDGSATGIIRNDDNSLSIAATSADKPEGDSGGTTFTFTVTRTGDLSAAASAQWAVAGSAVTGADFAGGVLPSGTVSFAAGETSKVITIEVAGDSTVEPDEAFSVTLSSPSTGTNLGTASATGIIRNDDNSLSIAATSADKPEGDSGGTTFTFTVTRTGDLSGAASVDWAASGAAVFDADFIPFDSLLESSALISLTASEIGAFFPQIPTDADAFLPAFSLFGGAMPGGTLNFAAGESSKIIHVWALGEILAERDESFVITLSNASEGVSLDTASAVGTIRDDDGAGTIRSSVSLTLSPEFTKLILTDAANIDGTGNALDNQLFGNAGNNVLDGRAGADRMAGGLGNDTYIVDDAGDVVFEAADEGTDEVQSSVSFSLANGFIDNIILAGSDDIDATGNALDNHITGNAGNNRLYGGAGNDSFRFDTALSPLTNVDTIIDFNVSDDTILLANAIFTALTVTGTLAEAAFHIGPAAASTDHRIIYDNVSGDLFYDPNGDAAGGSILFAHLLPGLALTFQDFLVI